MRSLAKCAIYDPHSSRENLRAAQLYKAATGASSGLPIRVNKAAATIRSYARKSTSGDAADEHDLINEPCT